MSKNDDRQRNQQAFRRLNDTISQRYPPGTYVAIFDEQILAHADSFEQLENNLRQAGKDSVEVLVIQAGVNYPERVTILHS